MEATCEIILVKIYGQDSSLDLTTYLPYFWFGYAELFMKVARTQAFLFITGPDWILTGLTIKVHSLTHIELN